MAPAQPPPLLSTKNTQHVSSTCATFDLSPEQFHSLKRHAAAAKDTRRTKIDRDGDGVDDRVE